MLDYWAYMDALKAYCRELGLPVIGTHALRHSVGAVYLAHGAGRGDVQQLLGHESASTTERYLHGRGTGVDAVARKLRLIPNDPKSEESSKTAV
jgi:integrase